MKATEELIIAEHQLEKLNMQLVSDLQKQNLRFKNYSWSFLDKELQKQDLDKLAVSKLRRNIYTIIVIALYVIVITVLYVIVIIVL